MPTLKYVCTNLANCDKALSKEVIELDGADEPKCPECGLKLTTAGQTGTGKGKGFPKPLLALVAAVVVVILAAAMLWPRKSPEKADALLSEYYPNLPEAAK